MPKPRIRVTEQFLVTITREDDIPNFTDVIGGRLWSIDKVASDGVIVNRVEATPVPAHAPAPFRWTLPVLTLRERIGQFIAGRPLAHNEEV